jgi:elongation factor Ts
MSNITPQMVKTLREKTGAGMADCKKALEENNGNMDESIDYLRKKGAASAAKRAEREAKEGAIVARTSKDGKNAILVEINSETDFVAKNAGFVEYTQAVGDALISSNANTVEELMKVSIKGTTVENLHNDILAKFSEKIEIRRIKRISSQGYIESYVHAGGKLAVLVEVSCDKLSENGRALLRDVAMQIAAMNPLHIDKSDVSQETLVKEKAIYIEQAIAEGKKPEIAERIATGRIEKYYEEFCLMQQNFVKDGSKVVGAVVAEMVKDCGCDLKVLSFIRYTLGGNE